MHPLTLPEQRPAETDTPQAPTIRRRNPYWFWRVLAIGLGLISAWSGRHFVFPDGISYIEVADAYLRGDLAHAMNSYWSPLYPWAIALTKLILRPDSYWEFASVHVVNFVFYAVSLACFELFIRRFLGWLESGRGPSPAGPVQRTYRTLGYCLFLWVGLFGINLVITTPDQLVAAIVYLACALLLDIHSGRAGWRTHVLLGLVLGIGYLTKASMFPAGLLFLLASIPVRTSSRPRALWRFALSLVLFLATCAPFVAVLSVTKGRLTLGDSGRLNYAWENSGVRRFSHWQGGPDGCGKPIHPTMQIRSHPEVFAFAAGPGGSYPIWTDPSYWYDGVRFHFNPRLQFENLAWNVVAVLLEFLLAPGAIAAVLVLTLPRRRRALADLRRYWFLVLPSIGAIALYALVAVHTRYVSMFVAVIALVCLGAAHLENLPLGWRRFYRVSLIGALLFAPGAILSVHCYATAWDVIHWRELVPNRKWELAEEARQLGLKRGSRVGFIGTSIAAYWLHVAGAQVAVEVPIVADLDRGLNLDIDDNMRETDAFWRSDKATRLEILEEMHAHGAAMVFADRVPSWANTEDWHRFNALLPAKEGLFATYVYRFPETHALPR